MREFLKRFRTARFWLVIKMNGDTVHSTWIQMDEGATLTIDLPVVLSVVPRDIPEIRKFDK